MPPFKIRSKIEGKGLFKNMGIQELFTDKAQLSKITDDKPVGKQTSTNDKLNNKSFVAGVGNIIHEAVIDVTKNGTEGAAATGIELTFFSAGNMKTKDVIINKPFIFNLEVIISIFYKWNKSIKLLRMLSSRCLCWLEGY